MFVRRLLIAVAALLGACSVETSDNAGAPASDEAGGYTLQVVADENVQTYYVTGPDDRAAAARTENGASRIIDANEARLAFGEARAAAADLRPTRQ